MGIESRLIPVEGNNHPLAMRFLEEESIPAAAVRVSLGPNVRDLTLLSLPSDLLHHIFELMGKTNNVLENGKVVLKAGRVCVRFWKIATESPTLKTARKYYELLVAQDRLIEEAYQLNEICIRVDKGNALKFCFRKPNHYPPDRERREYDECSQIYNAYRSKELARVELEQAKRATASLESRPKGSSMINEMLNLLHLSATLDLTLMEVLDSHVGQLWGKENVFLELLNQIVKEKSQELEAAQKKLESLKNQYTAIITFAHSSDLGWEIHIPRKDLSGENNFAMSGRLIEVNNQLRDMDRSVASNPAYNPGILTKFIKMIRLNF